MIKKFISRLLGKPAAGAAADAAQAAVPVVAAPAAPTAPVMPAGKRVEVPVSQHHIDPLLVDERAVKVVRTLQQAGFQAYVVGGAVRDLLVGLRPKDFDVATDATPEQVKSLFRRAFIIGRRFRIVHVIHGRGRDHEVIEVSTFRAYMDNSEATQVAGNEKTSRAALAGSAHAVDASGRVLRDNVWGPQVEDAARRDFSINAMYYDPASQLVIDYHGGIADVKAKLLRMIGDPATRYREDPVRIIRALRFAAKLGFEFEPSTGAPIAETAPLLANVPISRMFDEMIKLLQTGHALASIATLKRYDLHRSVFPVLDAVFDESRGSPLEHGQKQAFIRQALADTDRRVGEGKPVAPSFLLACLLWHDVLAGWTQRQAEGEPTVQALQQAVDAVFDARIGDISGRGKLGADMREIWMMQPRFERRQSNTAHALIELARFRAGFDFLRLRADVGEAPTELAEWWEDFSMGSDEEREALLVAVREVQRPRKGGASRGGKPTAPAASGEAAEAAAHEHPAGNDAEPKGQAHEVVDNDFDDAEGAAETTAPARKRRRRRRKPAGAAAGEAAAYGGGQGGTGDAPAGSA